MVVGVVGVVGITLEAEADPDVAPVTGGTVTWLLDEVASPLDDTEAAVDPAEIAAVDGVLAEPAAVQLATSAKSPTTAVAGRIRRADTFKRTASPGRMAPGPDAWRPSSAHTDGSQSTGRHR